MKILAIECSANTASVAITDDRRLTSVYTRNAGRTHSEILLPMVEKLLSDHSMTVADIDLFACAVGPGSFTGIRIGVSMIKGLAFASGKPCVGVSSIEALAYGFDRAPDELVICPTLDCRRGNVYNALFAPHKGSAPERLCDDRMISASALARELAACGKTALICGDGAALIEKTAAQDPENYRNIIIAPSALLYPSAYSVALCAYDKYEKDGGIADRELAPVYLRPTQAERELKGEKE